MKTHALDLNALLDQARKESYQAGYHAALQEVSRFINANLGKMIEGMPSFRGSMDGRARLAEGSLAALVLSKIEAHPDGIHAAEIKEWVRTGSSRYAGHAYLGKRIDTTLTRLKTRWGAIAKKDNGKWYHVAEDSQARAEAA
jgi:hypothetical protein